MTTNEDKCTNAGPRIYVASLADYTAGRLHGRWINADQTSEQVRAEIDAVLAESHEPVAEEWAIHDYENFGALSLGEYEDIERVTEAARLITEHGPVFGSLAEHFGGLQGLDEARQCMTEGYSGEYDSVVDYVMQFVDDVYGDVLKGLPDFLRYHIDWDGIANDFELSGDILVLTVDHRVHVFQTYC